jgi:hypothetical protein
MAKGDIQREKLIQIILRVIASRATWTVDDVVYEWQAYDNGLSRSDLLRFVGPTFRKLQKRRIIKLTPEWRKSQRHSRVLPVWTKF